ncbi:MAG: RNA-protein complex protein Nop10 [Candidatus Thermoplasmatota archaeon]|jgi:H/ACA ribonucleoprotein complex subunit 3|nr:RNA-protein complex protein Nop10 [Candidatus Thermoplasmatota archaeon]
MSQILYCTKCNNYTLDKICSKCKENTIVKKPARFSPQDHYGKYRRKLKKIEKKG